MVTTTWSVPVDVSGAAFMIGGRAAETLVVSSTGQEVVATMVVGGREGVGLVT